MPTTEEAVIDAPRSDIEAAIATLDAPPGTGDAPPATPPATGDQPPATPPATGAPAPTAPAEPPAPTLPELKAPQSWKPQLRERWTSMPRELQEEVLRREREIAMGLQGAAETRRFQEEFNRVTSPYQQYLAAHANDDPLKAFGNYLQTATLLRTGSPAEKANAVAQAIMEYGVDVTQLDTALARVLQGQPAPTAAPSPQQFRDPRVDALIAEQAETARVSALTALDTFANDPANEHYQTVKLTMADLMEMAANRGEVMSLKAAYDKAVSLSPEAQEAIRAKSAQNQQLESARKVAAAKKAATPGSGAAAPAPTIPKAGDGTLSDDIRNAIEKLTPAD